MSKCSINGSLILLNYYFEAVVGDINWLLSPDDSNYWICNYWSYNDCNYIGFIC